MEMLIVSTALVGWNHSSLALLMQSHDADGRQVCTLDCFHAVETWSQRQTSRR